MFVKSYDLLTSNNFENGILIYKSKQGLNQHNVLFLLSIEKINDAAAGYSSSEDITVKFDLSKDALIIEV